MARTASTAIAVMTVGLCLAPFAIVGVCKVLIYILRSLP